MKYPGKFEMIIPDSRKVVTRLIALLFLLVLFTGNQRVAAWQIDDSMQAINRDIGDPFPIDQRRVADQGIEIFRGKHIELYSDLRDKARCLELINAFDAAVPKWCAIFDIDAAKAKPWKIRAFLIANANDVTRFDNAGLVNNVPPFAAGFQRDHNIWFFAQPGDYYTRHLLLHEGTHAFMQWFTGGYGAPWFSEGMAELIGLHRWQPEVAAENRLTLQYRLKNKSEAEYWGRVKLIRKDRDAGNGMSLDDVLQIPPNAFRDVRFYAWSWAGCEFFSRHPKTRDAFQSMTSATRENPTVFNAQFRQLLEQAEVDWNQLQDEWELLVSEIEYGFLVERATIAEVKPLNGQQLAIRSDHSWQQSTIKVERGQRWSIKARGRFSAGQLITPILKDNETLMQSFPIECTANGVTAYHYQRRPLGQLVAGIWETDEKSTEQRTRRLVQPIDIGDQATIEIAADGILCFRINESPAKLGDNKGSLEVIVKRLE
ncbi:MAG: hypothetical protein AAFN77_13825 [Planctomycetota bacterium]